MSADATYHCDLAVIGDVVQRDVVVTVRDGRIVSVDAPSPAPPGAIRLPGLVVPGFANAHSHAFHRALRGRTQVGTGSFWTWRDAMYDVAGRLDPDRYHRLARAAFAEMALAGITAIGEFHYVHHRPDGTPYADPNAMGEALIAAAGEVGIRITLLDALYLHGGLTGHGYAPPSRAQRRFADVDVEDWMSRVERITPGPGHRVGAAIHSVRAVDPASIERVAAWAHERAAPIHVHVSEQPAENEQCLAAHGCTPTALLRARGALGPTTTLVHATHLTDDDVASIATAEATVCFCPTTERDLGDGIGPSAELVAAGIPICLGSDSHAVVDHLEEARAVELDERLRSLRRGVHPAATLLGMATANGHRSLGWDDAGELAPGRRGDLVAVSLDSVRTAGASPDTALESVVFAATSADVTHVVADGVLIVADGRHRSIDAATELRAAIEELS